MYKLLAVVLVFGFGVAWADAAPPLVNGGSATLEKLAGTDTLVTVVLKGKGAEDQNLKILEVGPDYLSVLTQSNKQTPYLFSSIQEIRVQSGKVKTKEFNIEESRSLKIDEQKVVDRAIERTAEIFGKSNDNQGRKMRAAVLLGIEGKKEPIDYLRQLAASNSLDIKLDAAWNLYKAGETEFDKKVIEQGLASGNMRVKSIAALMAGLVHDTGSTVTLMAMLNDRSADNAAPAARALARMGNMEALPALMKMIMELNQTKGDAAIFALARLGGPEVTAQVKAKLDTAEGQMRYRLVTVLYKLGDPLGKKLMEQEMLQTPTLAQDAALALAADADWDGMEWLRRKLKLRFDETPDKLIFRAVAAIALVKGGDGSADSYLQDLLGTDTTGMKPEQLLKVKKRICTLIGTLGKRRLITIMQPSIESGDADLALSACDATMAMARPSYHQRLIELCD